MPKLKTNSGAKKRFKLTKNGKVKRAKGYKRHMLEAKSSKRKRQLRGPGLVHETELDRVKRMLPYG
ncbi:MAG TPA: 50S ribosomal protein L35 [Spirochaetota bacterium]|jgi:large subunit ribosomal protein L35|nr:50S ribosomal protein L35 [Spirochaetota bacterium]OPZ37776.1 MAG: 50S ribosomal protein L35 [Spirochaetes bacterium ADurb.BinA120]HNU90720.1 50S ribosomal protein L35 [Spirochaetota bacterium]HPI15041.1 50S ribosomal protein L35 [Spirochaetota bacterium]HPV96609.1 50S ribosomal protein L35 [Spirochaetota bacterium]